MNERERLIDLIKHDNCPNPYHCSYKCKYVELIDCHPARLADCILADGWIRPPVRIGQQAYTIIGQKNYPAEWEVVGIFKSQDTYTFTMFRLINGKYEESRSFTEEAIGMIVFLTKEEAKKALEVRNNGKK